MADQSLQDNISVPSVGQILKEAREIRAISLETVAKNLCINKRQLANLEADNENLICDVYTLGFLRSYAQFLDLNASGLVQKFKAQTAAPPSAHLSFPTPLPEGGKPSLRILFLSLLAIVVVIAGYEWWKRRSSPPQQEGSPLTEAPLKEDVKIEEMLSPQAPLPPALQQPPLPMPSTETAAPPPTPPLAEAPLKEDVKVEEMALPQDPVPAPQQPSLPMPSTETVAPPPTSQPVLLKATEETWIEVRDERGDIVLSRLFYPQDTYEFTDSQNFVLKTGNANGVHLTSGEKTLVFPGRSGEIKSGIPLNPDKWTENEHHF